MRLDGLAGRQAWARSATVLIWWGHARWISAGNDRRHGAPIRTMSTAPGTEWRGRSWPRVNHRERRASRSRSSWRRSLSH